MNQDYRDQAKILVIDDDETSAELLKIKLDALGYEVTIALTAEQGINADAKIRPHLILLDVVLPEMSGFEVCRKLIERHKDNRYVPIILVTGMNDENAKIRGLESGAYGYVTKPYDAQELLARAPSALRIIVRDPDSGRAVAGAAVRVRYLPRNEGEAASLWFQGETDELGLSVADVQPEEADLGDGRLEVQVDAGPAGRVAIQAPARVGRARRILLTTDKPLYQPSQTIHLRALVLGGADGGGGRRQRGGRPGGRPGGPRPWPTRSTAAWDRRWAGSGSSRTSSSTRTCPAR